MFRKIFLCVAFYCGLSLMLSCNNNVSDPIQDLESLIEKVEKESESYTSEDWEDIAEKYSLIEEDMLNYEYTEKELREIGRLQGKLFGKVAKSALKDFHDVMDDLKKQVEGGIEGFLEEMGDLEEWEDF